MSKCCGDCKFYEDEESFTQCSVTLPPLPPWVTELLESYEDYELDPDDGEDCPLFQEKVE